MRIWCVDCNGVREMGVHGECGICGSKAIDALERNATFAALQKAVQVRELEKIWKRGE